MDDLDFSEDTTYKEQEDLPYDGDLIEKTELPQAHCDGTFNLIKDIAETFQQPDFSHTEMYPKNNISGALRCTDDIFPETPLSKKHSKEELCTGFFPIPIKSEGSSDSKMSDNLLHRLSKPEFPNAISPVAFETFPELSLESFDETLVKSLILLRRERSLSKGPIKEPSDQLLYKRNAAYNQASHRQLTKKENIFDFEESVATGDYFQGSQRFVTENASPNHLPTMGRGEIPQECLLERISTGSGLKYGQSRICPLSDFSQAAPQIRIPKPISNHKLTTVVKRTNSSPNLSEKSAIVQDSLDSMARYFLDRKSQENKEETTEFMQQLKLMTQHVKGQNFMDHLRRFDTKVDAKPLLDISEGFLSGLASETNVLKLPSTTEEQLLSSPSLLLKKTTKGDILCQELKEKTQHLKTQIEVFSKRINQDSTSLQDNKQVLEKLQGYLETLEQSYLSIKEKHWILQNQDKISTAFGEFDTERKVEGEIFKVKTLLENVKERTDENSSDSFLAHSSDSPDILDFSSCLLPNEVPIKENGHNPSGKSEHEIKLLDLEKQGQGNSLIPFPKGKDESINKEEVIPTKLQETPSQDYLCELYPQIYLGLPRRDAALEEDEAALRFTAKEEVVILSRLEINQLAVKLSSDLMRAFSSLESDDGPGSLESIKQSVLRQDWHSVHELSESSNHTEYFLMKKDQEKDRNLRNQKKEKKNDYRKSKCGSFSVIIQEKAMNLNLSDSTYCTDSGDSFFLNSLNTSKASECVSCKNKRHKTRKKEFHYKYNYTGQNPINFSECDGFIRFCALSKNERFTSASAQHQTKDENLVEHQKNEHSEGSEKSMSVCSQQKKHHSLRLPTKSSQGQEETNLSEKRNLKTSKLLCPSICDKIANPSHYHSCRISGSKALYSIQNKINKNDSQILNTALDYALRTAIHLKETTEQMIQAIAMDLAKANGRRSHQQF